MCFAARAGNERAEYVSMRTTVQGGDVGTLRPPPRGISTCRAPCCGCGCGSYCGFCSCSAPHASDAGLHPPHPPPSPPPRSPHPPSPPPSPRGPHRRRSPSRVVRCRLAPAGYFVSPGPCRCELRSQAGRRGFHLLLKVKNRHTAHAGKRGNPPSNPLPRKKHDTNTQTDKREHLFLESVGLVRHARINTSGGKERERERDATTARTCVCVVSLSLLDTSPGPKKKTKKQTVQERLFTRWW